MVDHLSHLRGQAQIPVHLVVEERADACCAQAKRLGSEIQSLTDRTRFKMHVSISAIAVTAGRILKIADHRECQAGVTCQVLSQAQSRRHQTLVPFLDFLERRVLRSIAVNARCQTFDAMDVKVQVNETNRSEISEQRLPGAVEESGKLREGDRLVSSPEIESGTPGANDVAKAAASGRRRRQADFAAARMRLGSARKRDQPRESAASELSFVAR